MNGKFARVACVLLQSLVVACAPEAGTEADVRDASGLIIQYGYSPDEQSQAESVAYCASLPGGWRLPSEDEAILVYDNRANLEPSPNWFWSSSPVTGSPSLGWGVYYPRGSRSISSIHFASRARCVR